MVGQLQGRSRTTVPSGADRRARPNVRATLGTALWLTTCIPTP
jgi:hypothetical protein